jgi:regulatory protein
LPAEPGTIRGILFRRNIMSVMPDVGHASGGRKTGLPSVSLPGVLGLGIVGFMPSDPATPPPDQGSLYQAALNHLARYATTEAGLRRVLMRRVDRWSHAQLDPEAAAPVIAAAREAIDGVIARLAKAGAVSDEAFAEHRAKSLLRSGQSNRAIQARLVAKGVAMETARSASASDAETELAAALVLARKRRIGPYRSTAADTATRMKEMGVLARAGFSRSIVERALDTPQEDAESRILELRR